MWGRFECCVFLCQGFLSTAGCFFNLSIGTGTGMSMRLDFLSRKVFQRLRVFLGVGFVALFVGSCATSTLRTAVPNSLANEVQVVGIENVRFWGDAPIPNFKKLADIRYQQIRQKRPELLNRKKHHFEFLALSGGGADGAFGAGFLNGWTATGTRPEFEVVAGVSAGALLAPFAFLGPEHDDKIREIFTLYSTKDILMPNVLAGLLGGTAVASSEPLAKLIARYIDHRFLAAVAREHEKGRRLLVGTTNLDAQRPVIWNMGLIAKHRSKRALELFRKILLASSSIPGAFPPVFIEVQSGGKTFREMHVDGGTTDNAFLLPAHLDLRKFDAKTKVRWERRLSIIVNIKTGPSAEKFKETTFGIAGRSISTLIKQSTEGDLLKLYLRAKKNGIKFRFASVPVDFTVESKEPFDKAFMGALYARGYELASKGYKWQKIPPGL